MSNLDSLPKCFTTVEVAKSLKVDANKVRQWIRNGELRGVEVTKTRTKRLPKIRILAADLEAFLARRSIKPAPPRAARRARQAGVREFYS